MLESIRRFTLKYRGVLMYLIFGVLTTLVNYAVYLGWMHLDRGRFANVAATCAAWVVAVLFAYFTNRKWVFESSAKGFLPQLRECGAFFGSRLLTGLFDLGVMFVTVDILRLDGGIMKLASNVAVVILNYILSKFLVFRKGS